MSDDPKLSRTPFTPPLGKYDASLPKIDCNSELRDDLQRLATEAGKSLTEFCRIRLEAVAWGEDAVVRMHEMALRRAMGNGGDKRTSSEAQT